MTAVNSATHFASTMHEGGERASRLLIVSNRLPISIRARNGPVQIVRSSGGLATGLEDVHRANRSVWIGWPGVSSDVPIPDWRELERRFQDDGLGTVPLSDEEVTGYCDGFSNGVIWPLFHHLLDRIPIDSGNWKAYQRANARFADAVVRIWQPGDRVWIHDYHLMLVPALVRRALPHARIGFFLHIPFPGIDVFRALPWRRELLEGVLGADVIGFHTRSYVQHFLTAVRQVVSVEPIESHVWWQGRAIHVDALPMGIDDGRFAALSQRPSVRARGDAIRTEAQGRKILLGVDRLDYTKGIPRRLLAFQRLLERHPSLAGRVRFIQVAVPSRIDVRVYKAFRRELDELIGHINGMFGTVDSVPIHYLYRSVPSHELVALYRAADAMIVTPLRDGMNLVAKEFVASRTDDDGVLVLSEFAGAAAELTDALIVNPYDVDAVADAMARAVRMDRDERRNRMRRLRARVSHASVHDWARSFLQRLGESEPERALTTSTADALTALEDGRLELCSPVVLVLDYDGTLVPIAETPEQACPDADLMQLLTAVAAHPEIDLHLVTGRSIAIVQQWFWHLQAGLWAEHGAACRREGGSWERIAAADRQWMKPAHALLTDMSAVTPGALVEQKTSSLAWHYRMVEPSLAASRLQRLKETLPAVLGDAPVEMLDGQMVLELRPRGVSKALVIRCLAGRDTPHGSMIVIGDDRTDEEMFGVTPSWGVAIHVGDGESRAPYRLADPAAVRRFLTRILTVRGARPSKRRAAYGP